MGPNLNGAVGWGGLNGIEGGRLNGTMVQCFRGPKWHSRVCGGDTMVGGPKGTDSRMGINGAERRGK